MHLIKPSLPVIVTLAVGVVLALLGVILFGSAHAITVPAPGDMTYDGNEQRLNLVLRSAFGIAVMVAGLLTAAVGMHGWRRQGGA